MIIRLATWVSVGVCASGYSVATLTRPERLSVTSNSGKFLSLVASDEETHDRNPKEAQVAEASPQQVEGSSDVDYVEATLIDGEEGVSGSDSGSNKRQEDTQPQPQELTAQ